MKQLFFLFVPIFSFSINFSFQSDSLIIQQEKTDWNNDGIKDEILLTKKPIGDFDGVFLSIVYYDKNHNVINTEESGDIGTGETGCCPTSFTILKGTIKVETSQMRNETWFKLRFNKFKKSTQLITKNTEYYTSGANGPGSININYIKKIKTTHTSDFNEKSQQFKYHKPVYRKIKTKYITLSEINDDQLFED